LPFALDVPVMPFKYPVEKTDITRAYLHFADWAQSGGSLFADWYGNTASSYRNTANIYNN
jgi:LruC domain-containing protein